MPIEADEARFESNDAAEAKEGATTDAEAKRTDACTANDSEKDSKANIDVENTVVAAISDSAFLAQARASMDRWVALALVLCFIFWRVLVLTCWTSYRLIYYTVAIPLWFSSLIIGPHALAE